MWKEEVEIGWFRRAMSLNLYFVAVIYIDHMEIDIWNIREGYKNDVINIIFITCFIISCLNNMYYA